MASNTISPPADTGPLSFMTRISPDVYHLRPPPVDSPLPSSSSSGPVPPKFILIASWLAARDMHIAKYIRPYQALYPAAEVLLVRSEMWNFLRPDSTSAELKAKVVPIIRAAFPDVYGAKHNTKGEPQMLIHLFSGGGSFIVSLIRNLLAPSGAMPPHTVIFDSAPPQFHYRGSYLAIVGGWTTTMRRLLWPVVHFLCVWFWFAHRVFDRRRGGPFARTAALHNERGGRASTEVLRTYIYGPDDALVKWRDVERHARDAEKKGFEVRLERFEGSAHVQHVRADEDRYWRIVRDTWEG